MRVTIVAVLIKATSSPEFGVTCRTPRTVRRGLLRIYMTYRSLFWNMALSTPFQNSDATNVRRNLISLCFKRRSGNALDLDHIDDYAYHSLWTLRESNGTLDPAATATFHLTQKALARVLKVIMSSRCVSSKWVQDRLFHAIDDGSHEIPSTPPMIDSKLAVDDVSDFEVHGAPSALLPEVGGEKAAEAIADNE
ncbi:hypothetical protein PHYPSEUDO_003612 [Phytophthora pseudosyringae]|uniref:Uncharacterized protein n=1 Tax=Phytophthora pseudosyringae TaxID=221518 RepID=A0A8T1VTZ5_9STRA|nr:hypothetical protein PHYPSEUDO_003612 [Phytophthora pseudosyringae]